VRRAPSTLGWYVLWHRENDDRSALPLQAVPRRRRIVQQVRSASADPSSGPGAAIRLTDASSKLATRVCLGLGVIAAPSRRPRSRPGYLHGSLLQGPAAIPPPPDPSSSYLLAGLTSEALTISAMADRTSSDRRGQQFATSTRRGSVSEPCMPGTCSTRSELSFKCSSDVTVLSPDSTTRDAGVTLCAISVALLVSSCTAMTWVRFPPSPVHFCLAKLLQERGLASRVVTLPCPLCMLVAASCSLTSSESPRTECRER